jgi:hypothetical protein
VNASSELIDKIRALYRLSKDPCNEHEAALAAEVVRRLLEKHNLSLSDIPPDRVSSTERPATRYMARVDRYTTLLADACALVFDVEWFVNIQRCGICQQRRVVFCGIAENVDAAVMTLPYFKTSVRSLLVRRDAIRSRRRQNSYKLGAAARVFTAADELKRAAASSSEQTTALVRIGSAVAKRHLLQRGVSTRKIAVRKKPRINQAFLLGYIDAEQISLRGAGRAQLA